MTRSRLSGRLGAALDPCGAIQVPFELADGAGARDHFPARRRTRRRTRRARWRSDCAHPARRARALESVRQYWKRTLGAVQVETPDPVVERPRERLAPVPDAGLPPLGAQRLLPVRRRLRLPRPAAGCDGAGRTPSRGWFASICCAAPAQQFPEGDVLHWWHPPGGRGVRTRCSDDYLWLPLAACRYVAITGDTAVLDETRAVPRGPRARPRRRVLLRPARPLRRSRPACTSTACARSSMACGSAGTACR